MIADDRERVPTSDHPARVGRAALPSVPTDATAKGSHGTLHYGSHKTTLKDLRKEIGTGLSHEHARPARAEPARSRRIEDTTIDGLQLSPRHWNRMRKGVWSCTFPPYPRP